MNNKNQTSKGGSRSTAGGGLHADGGRASASERLCKVVHSWWGHVIRHPRKSPPSAPAQQEVLGGGARCRPSPMNAESGSLTRKKRARLVEVAVVSGAGDSACYIALHRAHWAAGRPQLVAWCSAQFGFRKSDATPRLARHATGDGPASAANRSAPAENMSAPGALVGSARLLRASRPFGCGQAGAGLAANLGFRAWRGHLVL